VDDAPGRSLPGLLPRARQEVPLVPRGEPSGPAPARTRGPAPPAPPPAHAHAPAAPAHASPPPTRRRTRDTPRAPPPRRPAPAALRDDRPDHGDHPPAVEQLQVRRADPLLGHPHAAPGPRGALRDRRRQGSRARHDHPHAGRPQDAPRHGLRQGQVRGRGADAAARRGHGGRRAGVHRVPVDGRHVHRRGRLHPLLQEHQDDDHLQPRRARQAPHAPGHGARRLHQVPDQVRGAGRADVRLVGRAGERRRPRAGPPPPLARLARPAPRPRPRAGPPPPAAVPRSSRRWCGTSGPGRTSRRW